MIGCNEISGHININHLLNQRDFYTIRLKAIEADFNMYELYSNCFSNQWLGSTFSLTIADRNFLSSWLMSSVSMSAEAAHSSLKTSSSTPSSYKNLEAIIYQEHNKTTSERKQNKCPRNTSFQPLHPLEWVDTT